MLAEDVAEAFGVEKSAGADNFAGWQARLFLNDIGNDVDGVGGDNDNAVEAFGEESRDARAHDDDVSREHVETRALKFARCADCDDDDGTGRSVFVGSREDLNGGA